MDVREREFLREYRGYADLLKHRGYRIELIFLDSSDDVLIQRFSETAPRSIRWVKGGQF